MGVDRTFLFSDIEGSTQKWEAHPALMRARPRPPRRAHDRGSHARNRGSVVSHTGDGVLAVFDAAADALSAADEAQHRLADVEPSEIEPLRVRMGIHRGSSVEVGGNFFGPTLNRCARMMAVAHGGQVVVSDDVAHDPSVAAGGFALVDLGSHQLRDVPRPVSVFQLALDGLPADFPPLRTVGQKHHNLPGPVSTFIGRVKVLESVDEMLETRRLVTIVGSGGCGKLARRHRSGGCSRRPLPRRRLARRARRLAPGERRRQRCRRGVARAGGVRASDGGHAVRAARARAAPPRARQLRAPSAGGRRSDDTAAGVVSAGASAEHESGADRRSRRGAARDGAPRAAQCCRRG